MTKLKMTVELTYNADLMHGDDTESINWFHNLLKNDELILHSNEIGDEIGTVRVLKISGSSSEEHTLANSSKSKEEILGVKLEVNPNLEDGQFVLSSESEL